jgi:glutaredoxin
MDQREVVLYRSHSLNSWRAERFLRHIGYTFEVIDTSEDPESLVELSKVTQRSVASPYLLVEGRPVGDLGTIRALAHSGQLEHLVRDDL